MSWIDAIFLGFIQGLTEFLPVSSSGHLVVFQKLLGQLEHDIFFDVVAHVGTLLAIVLIFKDSLSKTLSPIFAKSPRHEASIKMLKCIVIASLPTAILGLLFKSFFESMFSNLQGVAFAFAFTAIVLFFTLKAKDNRKVFDMTQGLDGMDSLSYWKALLIGLAQAAAICPGISRSGLTIATGLYLHVRKDTATLFSFLIAIPAILGAMLIMLIRSPWHLQDLSIYLVGFLSAFVFGYIGLKSLIAMVRKGNLAIFSFYLVLLSIWCYNGLSF